MIKQWWFGGLALVAMGCGGSGGSDNGGGGGNAIASETVAAVTDDRRIVVFDTNAPGTLLANYTVTGLPSDDPVASLDYRPAAANLLYLVTQSGALYTVGELGQEDTLAATRVGAITTNGEDVEEIDFNPVADRLRVATDDNGSLRVDVTTAATTVDGDFAYADSTAADIEGVAYTNSFQTATSTVLYGIDVERDALVRVDPPNSGTLTVVGTLGVDLEGPVPFDISPADATLGFIAPSSGGRSRIYTVDIETGATVRGRQTPSGVRIVGLTVLPQS
jgi:hypothetical protein